MKDFFRELVTSLDVFLDKVLYEGLPSYHENCLSHLSVIAEEQEEVDDLSAIAEVSAMAEEQEEDD